MKEIEAFVDSVYQNVGGNKKEIQELKDEMKGHLIEAVHELKLEGKSEQEAIEISIERFGGEKEMRSIVGQLFKAQRTFAKWVLYTALTFLLISFIGYGILIPLERNQQNESYQFSSQILDSLGNTITEQAKTDIQKIVQENENITGVTISAVEVTNYGNETFYTTVSEEPEYSFREKPIFNHFITYRADGTGNENWDVMVESKGYVETAYTALFLSVCIYWVLFAIWAIINAYHHRRLNAGWVIVFALLNVVGYLFFRFIGKGIKNERN
ncbi:permease prefix domain 1-containing protein [Peribacillus frigoritolerans]|uniref:permease prefix domain 1-containing protein n=1 Tax=Peribacillus frigoritolerans TaxID=450367 RepID=UPI00227DC0F1|nr:permease prefix domain 1-containing protein [Peribacillus frigoritolerans]MCY8940033.1 permease prefix domain 1-containing protein [Peribacillus frigoritolerans]